MSETKRDETSIATTAKKVNPILWPFVQCQRFVRFLYDWVLSWAHSRWGTAALATLSFAESSFFPIPPDVLQMALSIERPKRSFYYAAVSAVASVFGAVLGWYIGFALWDAVGPFFVPNIISVENMESVRRFFDDWGFWALFAAAFTPLPFKAFTITAGIAGMSIPIFVVSCLIGRSARFFLMGGLIYVFGPTIKSWIDKYFGPLTLAFLVLLVGGFYGVGAMIGPDEKEGDAEAPAAVQTLESPESAEPDEASASLESAESAESAEPAEPDEASASLESAESAEPDEASASLESAESTESLESAEPDEASASLESAESPESAESDEASASLESAESTESLESAEPVQ